MHQAIGYSASQRNFHLVRSELMTSCPKRDRVNRIFMRATLWE